METNPPFTGVFDSLALIVDIDNWMILRCIELLASSRESAPLAVNVSGRTFDDADLAGFIQSELTRTGVAPTRLHQAWIRSR